MMANIIHFLLLLILFLLSNAVNAEQSPLFDPKNIFHPVVAKNGMVSSADSYATKAGLDVLKEGGNAIDAAVTVAFTLAVTFPRAGNLGGGGFMIIYRAGAGEVIAVDYREKAPKTASRDMFLDEKGKVDQEKSLHSVLAVGVPGTVAGLALALEKYGTISLKRALKPAIELAENGFSINKELSMSLISVREKMRISSDSIGIFFKEQEIPYEEGEILKQKDLGWSLRQISRDGADAFYRGAIAERLVEFMRSAGGLITHKDLESYKAVIRKPVRGNYRGYEIYSMPPPSAGGVHLIQMLNLLEAYPIGNYGHNTAKAIHVLVESMKLAFADRSQHLGDPDFVSVPVDGLISKTYARQLRGKINEYKAKPSDQISPDNPNQYQGGTDTTHFSVMDKFGNAVSNTYTLNLSYGTKLTAPGTGILLNNEMDDFASKPGVANAYGLIGGEYNAIEPEKRMLSSMTPTIVVKRGKPYLVTGSPGGGKIITTVLQIILNVVDFGMNIASATNAVRVHHQWVPDDLVVEQGLNYDTIRLLNDMGHRIVVGNTIGSVQSVMQIDNYLFGASDPRQPGSLTEGY